MTSPRTSLEKRFDNPAMPSTKKGGNCLMPLYHRMPRATGGSQFPLGTYASLGSCNMRFSLTKRTAELEEKQIKCCPPSQPVQMIPQQELNKVS